MQSQCARHTATPMTWSQKWDEPETVFVMDRRSYKYNANIGLFRRSNRLFFNIPETVYGPSFIRKDTLPESIWNLIKPAVDNVCILDVNSRSVHVGGTIELSLSIAESVQNVCLNVIERLETTCIVGCDYCDKPNESIRHRKPLVELRHGTVLRIIRKPYPRA